MDNIMVSNIMKGCKVLLCPSLSLAQKEAAKYSNGLATVEAEYGSTEVVGTDDMGIWKNSGHHIHPENDPPCIKNKSCGGPSPIIPQCIIVSHLDLDTIGGIGLLLGYCNPEEAEFWEAAGYIDCNGPHHILSVPEKAQKQLRAYWAYNDSHRPPKFPRDAVTDVTALIAEYFAVIDKIVVKDDQELIKAGEEWENGKKEKVESCLVYESAVIRGFAGPEFTAAAYLGSDGVVRTCTVSLSTKKRSITLGFEDGGKVYNAAKILKELYGEGAGGHAGIAGTPREQVCDVFDLVKVIKHMEGLLSK